jgi:hypothetical protein
MISLQSDVRYLNIKEQFFFRIFFCHFIFIYYSFALKLAIHLNYPNKHHMYMPPLLTVLLK